MIGIGNPADAADALGLIVARAIARACPGARLHEIGGDLAALVELLADARRAIVVDATRGAGPPGTITLFSPDDLRGAPFVSSHALDLPTALALAGALGRLPPALIVLGVEPPAPEG